MTTTAENVIDLVQEYINLDPNGEYFIEEGVEWNTELQEAVVTEFICKLSFPKLLGERPEVPDLEEDYVPIPSQVEYIRAAMFTGQNLALSGPPGSGK